MLRVNLNIERPDGSISSEVVPAEQVLSAVSPVVTFIEKLDDEFLKLQIKSLVDAATRLVRETPDETEAAEAIEGLLGSVLTIVTYVTMNKDAVIKGVASQFGVPKMLIAPVLALLKGGSNG